MEIFKSGSRATRRAAKEYFTGDVWQDPLIDAPAPSRVHSTRVTFAPGGRTFWHTHPYGQTLYILAGTGRVQEWGGPLREVKAGDVVWFGPDVKHWHGASPTHTMVHVAIQEDKNGSYIAWSEEVSEEQYNKTPE
jgi:quercetin dioxygenase-like cupin family protein